MLKVGLRVVRGKDWKWAAQDGGEGTVGTVVKVQGIPGKRSLVVTWDGGLRANYRAGLEDANDLRILDNGPVGENHPSVVCDECKTNGIHGLRWKCTKCDDYDLCNTCYVTNKHDLSHTFYRFDTNMSHCVLVPARQGSRRIQSKGTFVGAKVIRGSDWCYGNQDGGSGKQGEVIRIVTAKAETTNAWDSCVEVKWGNGNKNSYRRGFNGKVEIKCEKPAIGNFYYVDHLPHICDYEYGMLEKGDWVKLVTATLSNTDKTLMCSHIDSIGVITEKNSSNRAVVVRFDSKSQYTIRNFSVLTKVRQLRKGDSVKILGNKEKVKELQGSHGGWVENMAQTIGKTGKVVAVDSDGDVKVRFPDATIWTYNPTCCTLIQAAPESQNDDNNDNDRSAEIETLAMLMSAMLGLPVQQSQTVFKPEKLMEEAYKGNTQNVRAILQKFPNQADTKFKNKTSLQLASHQGHVSTVKVLLEGGATPGIQDDEGDTAYHFAVYGNKPDALTALLTKSSSDIDVRNNKGVTALQVAVAQQSIACVKVLLNYNANVDIMDSDGDPAIHEAIHRGNPDIIQLLIGCGRCDYRIKNNNGLNALHFAAVSKNSVALQKLLKAAPNLVNVQMSNGSTALHVASSVGSLRIVDLLINAGKANINMQDTVSSSTPLHYAVREGHASVVQLIVNKGADVNIEDEDGDTPLHLIFLHVLPSNLSILNSSAPDQPTDLVNADDITKIERELPSQIKEHRTWIALGCFLVAHGGDLNHSNRQNLTPLSAITDSSVRQVLMKYDRNNKNSSQPSPSKIKVDPVSSSTTSPQKCITCNAKSPEIKFLPCGHEVVCSTCKKGLKLCPVCQKSIQEILRSSMQQTMESLTRQRSEKGQIENPNIICEEIQEEKSIPNSSQSITRVPSEPVSKDSVSNATQPKQPASNVPPKPSNVSRAPQSTENGSNASQTIQHVMNTPKPAGPAVETVTCTKCNLEPRCVLFMPCSHSSCSNCSDTLTSCHVCSADIMTKLKLFN